MLATSAFSWPWGRHFKPISSSFSPIMTSFPELFRLKSFKLIHPANDRWIFISFTPIPDVLSVNKWRLLTLRVSLERSHKSKRFSDLFIAIYDVILKSKLQLFFRFHTTKRGTLILNFLYFFCIWLIKFNELMITPLDISISIETLPWNFSFHFFIIFPKTCFC